MGSGKDSIMARPQPTILDMTYDGDTTINIIACDAMYALIYQGRRVSIRKTTRAMDKVIHKYSKTQWPNKKTAERIAKKLNTQFMTTDFDIVEVV
jgi:hypothetical protein